MKSNSSNTITPPDELFIHPICSSSRTAGIIVLDEQFNVIEMARSVNKLLLAKDSLVGESLTKYLKKAHVGLGHDDRLNDGAQHLLEWVMDNGQPQQFVMELGDESLSHWLSFEVIKIKHPGGLRGLVVTVVDITKYKRQEELFNKQMIEITDQNRQWQAIYNSMLESIIVLNTNGRVLTMNPATEKISGYKTSEGIGKHVGEIFPKVDATVPGVDEQGRSGLYQAVEDQRASDLFEAVVATKDGRHIWVNYTYTPLRDAKGEITAFVRVTSDVSTVKAVDQMKNDFVSIASHELRTPLGVINSYLNLFLNGQLGSLTEDQKVYLKRVFNASGDMSALVEDLLNMSRIESGKLDLAVQPFYMRDLIEEVLSQLEHRYQAKRIKIKVVQPKDLFLVHADRQKLEQALTNIIDNAIKYTYDKGVIVVTIKNKKGGIIVSVKDSGVGIKPENMGHIFEKFYREGNPLSVKEGGSGLGLYISRKLIELHGGTISVTSKRRLGSTFSIQLPNVASSSR